jgi:hypothetical protein
LYQKWYFRQFLIPYFGLTRLPQQFSHGPIPGDGAGVKGDVKGGVRAEIALTKHVLHESLITSDHLAKMAFLPDLLNSDLEWGFPIPQVAEKHGWTESMVVRGFGRQR